MLKQDVSSNVVLSICILWGGLYHGTMGTKKRKNESSLQTMEDLGSVNWGTVRGAEHSSWKVKGISAESI